MTMVEYLERVARLGKASSCLAEFNTSEGLTLVVVVGQERQVFTGDLDIILAAESFVARKLQAALEALQNKP